MSEVQRRVQGLIDEITATPPEVGLQVAAYHHGELVVDAWSGVADVAAGRPIDGDTVFAAFSVSKGVTATIAHLLAERGQLDYDAPIAAAWEANANGGISGDRLFGHTGPHLERRSDHGAR
jgi:CubicO group peptidase (beta-lactamase class C family)